MGALPKMLIIIPPSICLFELSKGKFFFYGGGKYEGEFKQGMQHG